RAVDRGDGRERSGGGGRHRAGKGLGNAVGAGAVEDDVALHRRLAHHPEVEALERRPDDTAVEVPALQAEVERLVRGAARREPVAVLAVAVDPAVDGGPDAERAHQPDAGAEREYVEATSPRGGEELVGALDRPLAAEGEHALEAQLQRAGRGAELDRVGGGGEVERVPGEAVVDETGEARLG